MSSSAHDRDPAATKPARSSRERARLLAVAILAVVATVLALANLDRVKVDLVATSARMPLIVLIVICLLLGAFIGALLGRHSGKHAHDR